MSTAAEDDYDSTAEASAWIAAATRRFAGLSEADNQDDNRWAETGSTITQLRAGIAQRISLLPRQGKRIRTSTPGISVSHIALAKLLTEALAEPAAATAAAVADVELTVRAESLSAVRVHLIAIGADERDRTYLQDGDALCGAAALVVQETIGDNSAEITAVWDDIVITAD